MAILAATYIGLTSVATGGDFMGSPFLLSRWLRTHLSRIGPVKTNFIEEWVCLLSSAPISVYTRSIPYGHKHQARGFPVELELIGPTHFVVYNSHRCYEMVGHKKDVPPLLSSIPRIWTREHGSPVDAALVYYIRALWTTLECHDDLDGAHFTPLTCSLLREDEHWSWYSKLLPKPKEWVEETGVLRKKRKRLVR